MITVYGRKWEKAGMDECHREELMQEADRSKDRQEV